MNITQLKDEFINRFGEGNAPIRFFTSPGRVNLIGEHTDYNGGYVLPAAITLATTVAVRQRNDNLIRLAATDLDVLVEADINKIEEYKQIEWGNYQLGVVSELQKAGYDITGLDMLYHDTVPHGSGLSSSAAIEVATALCFASYSNEKNGVLEPIDMKQMAIIGQKAENNYVGVACGIMDQFASAMGKRDHAVFLDCSNLSYRMIPISLKDESIIISNTNKKRSLIVSKYNERRAECEKGLAALKTVIKDIDFLADVCVEDFEKHKHVIGDETIIKRVEHVVYECDRVKRSAEALSGGDILLFGKLMNLSHTSLRDLYEVTGDELDTLADAAWGVEGCIGSRMTGAGFGGCTVSIVKNSCIDEFKEKVSRYYEEKMGYAPSFYVTKAGDGGREIK